MCKRILLFLILPLALLVPLSDLCPAAAQAGNEGETTNEEEEAELVRILSETTTFGISLTGTEPNAIIPIKQTDPTQTLSVQLLDVAFGNTRRGRFMEAFEPHLLPESESEPAERHQPAEQIRLKFNPTKAPEHGSYSLLLGVMSGTTVQELRVTLIKPKGELEASSTLLAEREIYIPWLSADTTFTPLELREIGGDSPVGPIQLWNKDHFNSGKGPVPGHLEFRKNCETVPVNEDCSVDYSLSDGFPLGDSTGNYSISSPQTDSQLSVAVTVKNRLARIYIFLFILLGVWLSYLTKGRLSARIQLLEAVTKANRLLQRLEQEKASRDRKFAADVNRAQEHLKRVKAGSDPQAITDAITALNDKIDEAVTDFDERKDEASKLAESMGQLIATAAGVLPAVLAQQVEGAEKDLEEVKTLLQKNKVAAADKKADEIRSDFLQMLRRPAKEWRCAVEFRLKAIGDDPSTLSPAAREVFKKKMEETLTAVRRSKDPTASSEVSVFIEEIGYLSSGRTKTDNLMTWVGEEIERETRRARQELKGVRDKLKDWSKVEHLVSVGEKLSQVLDAVADDPEALEEQLREAMDNLVTAWQGATLEQIDDATVKDAVKDLLKQGKHLEAVQKVEDHFGAGIAAGLSAGAPAEHAPWHEIKERFQPTARESLHMLGWTGPFRPEAPPQIPDKVELRRLQFMRSAIAAVLLSLGGSLLFWDSFVGNWHDFVTILLWAFGLDLTLETVTNLPKPQSD